jgi:carboxypeptidase D
MAYNNTYGIQVISEAEYNDAMNSFPACRSLVEACRSLADTKDPTGVGNVEEVNTACSDAYNFCFAKMWEGVESRGVSVFKLSL